MHIGMEGHGSEESNRVAPTAGEMALLVPAMVPQHSKKSNLVEDIFSTIHIPRGAITINKNCEAGL